MERSEVSKKNDILSHLSTLPEKVLSLHGIDGVSQFVLHDLCNKDCFNLQKAAYIVDNPDFDCLRGVAGFSHDEAYTKQGIWTNPEQFISHMSNASFNQKVRSIDISSMRRLKKSDVEMTKFIADYVGIAKPAFCSWDMKHDNHGILVYETEQSCPIVNQYIKNGACFLGFCTVY